MTTGEKIRKARKEAKLTQTELAEKLGWKYQSVAQYETGKRNPKLETIKKIAAALGVHERDLMGDYDLSDPDQPDIPGPSLADDIKEKKPVSEENGLTKQLLLDEEKRSLLKAWDRAEPRDRRTVASVLEIYGFKYDPETDRQTEAQPKKGKEKTA